MPDPSRVTRRRTDLYLFLALLITYAYFFQGGGWHQNSRFDLVRAIAEDGSVRIDRFVGNTSDWARVGDRVLSNKLPGISLLAAPVHLVSRPLLEALDGSIGPLLRMSLQLHLLVVFAVSLPSAILGVVLLRFLRTLSPAAALPGVLAYSLGTLAFPWSTQFMAHQTGAAFLFGGAALIYFERRRSWAGGWGGPVLAGSLLGLAVTIDETAVFALPFLLVYVAWTGGWRRAAGVCLGGLGPAIVLLLYNAVAFGGPFRTARQYQNPRFVTDQPGLLFGVIGLPDPRVLLEVTILPRRGLFYYCPVLLFATAGLVAGARRPSTRPEAVAFLGVFGSLLLFNASFNGWHGGWSTGPRYLIPALPFLAVGIVWVPAYLRLPAGVAACVSIFLMTAVTAVNVSVPQDLANASRLVPPGRAFEDVRNPVRNYILPRLFRGDLSAHTQHVSEHRIGQHLTPEEARWASYNVGEWLGLPGLASLLPLAVLWGGFGLLVSIGDRRRSPTEAAAVEGGGRG